MKQGRWISKHQKGTWIPIKKNNPDDGDSDALKYGNADTAEKNAEGVVVKFTEFHPITKNGWFMKSKYANQQRLDNSANEAGASAMNNGFVSTSVEDAVPAAPPANITSW
jgi:hypothetical protein